MSEGHRGRRERATEKEETRELCNEQQSLRGFCQTAALRDHAPPHLGLLQPQDPDGRRRGQVLVCVCVCVRVYRQVISYRCIAGEHLIWIRVVEWDLIYASMYMYIYIYA